MRNYRITYDNDKVTTVVHIDAAHARHRLRNTVKVGKIHSCKIVKS